MDGLTNMESAGGARELGAIIRRKGQQHVEPPIMLLAVENGNQERARDGNQS